jgi:hypothetical protein
MATTQVPQGRASATPQGRDRREGGPHSSAILRRELLILGIALAFGLVLMPFLIWLVGNRILGPYTHGLEPAGGPLKLLGDFFVGLGHGSVIFWCVALGPYLLVTLARLLFALLRSGPVTSRSRG